jgi:hypothetical protein
MKIDQDEKNCKEGWVHMASLEHNLGLNYLLSHVICAAQLRRVLAEGDRE